MDIAGAYADPRVYQVVKAKWDTLPTPNDKKKGGKGKGSPKAKRPTTSGSGVCFTSKVIQVDIIRKIWVDIML